MTTTFRAEARTNLYALLNDFKDANPTLQQTYKARPPDFGSCPCAFVGGISEPRIVHDSGVRQRDLEIRLVLVDEVSDNEETAGRLDVLTDALLDTLTANPRAVSPYTVQGSQMRIDSTELDVGGVPYAANVLIVSAQIQEGRT